VNRVINELKAGWESIATQGARSSATREAASLRHGA